MENRTPHLIDREKLLAHLKKKSEHKDLLYHVALAGLITAVERGDFDHEEPDPVAVANAEDSAYFQEHPIQDDAGTGEENFTPPVCAGCGRTANQTGNYPEDNLEGYQDADHAMQAGVLDGTYNAATNHYWCDDCYIKQGQPLGVAP